MNLVDIMHYELCAYLAALSEFLMRKGDKSQLAEAIDKYTKHFNNEESDTVETTERYILDGRSLLHQIL